MSAAEAASTIKNSKVARSAIVLPASSDIKVDASSIVVSAGKNRLELNNHMLVNIEVNGKEVSVKPRNSSKESRALSGTYAALIKNMVKGVTDGFEKTLNLVGVGYRAKVSGKKLELTIGYSHPVHYDVPEGITIETPNQTTVVIKGVDKQKVGQVSAEIRAFRPPENYKGKGIRYADEYIIIKETKK